jgi:hypothetical protein
LNCVHRSRFVIPRYSVLLSALELTTIPHDEDFLPSHGLPGHCRRC